MLPTRSYPVSLLQLPLTILYSTLMTDPFDQPTQPEIAQPEVAVAPLSNPDAVPAITNPDAESMLQLEGIIKAKVLRLNTMKSELKKLKDMLESTLLNDETYRKHSELAKQAAKVRSATKMQILKLPENAELAGRVKELSEDYKELNGELEDNLREYVLVSGTNEIEGVDGEINQIVYVPKLVRKSSRHP